MTKPLSFNQKLSIFLGMTIFLTILSVVLIVMLSKQGMGGRIFANVYEEYSSMRAEQERKEKLSEAESLIKTNPKSGEGYAKRAAYYRHEIEYELALKDYNQAISLDPRRPEWYHARGQIFSNNDELEKAIQDYTKAIELKPQREYYFDRAQAYIDNNEGKKALPDLQKALMLDYPAAIVHERRGEAFIKTSQLDKAIDSFKKSIASPGNDEIDGNTWETEYSQIKSHRNLTNTYVALNDFDSALEQATAWIKKDEDDEEGYFVRARLHGALGDDEKKKADQIAGIACLTRRIDNYGGGYIFKDRAKAYREMGRIEEANADCRKAIDCYKREINDRGYSQDYYKSEIESLQQDLNGDVKSDTKDYQKEIAESSKEIAANPKEAELYSTRAGLYYNAKKPELALRDYEMAKRLDPTDTSFGMEVGRILISEKRYNDAVAEYTKLAQGEGATDSWLYTKMAQALELAGKHEEAIKSADKSIQLAPLDGDGYYWRSKAFDGKGDREKARASMTQAIALEFDEKHFE